jgi:hypothetical protein
MQTTNKLTEKVIPANLTFFNYSISLIQLFHFTIFYETEIFFLINTKKTRSNIYGWDITLVHLHAKSDGIMSNESYQQTKEFQLLEKE